MSSGLFLASPAAMPRAMAPAFRLAAAVASAVCSRRASVLFGEKQPDNRSRHAIAKRALAMMIRMQLGSSMACAGERLQQELAEQSRSLKLELCARKKSEG